jgi:hypothetical protein
MGNVIANFASDLQTYIVTHADQPIRALPKCDDPQKFSTLRELYLCEKGTKKVHYDDIVLCKNVDLVVHLHTLRGMDKLQIKGASIETWSQTATVPGAVARSSTPRGVPCTKAPFPNVTLTLIVSVPGLEGELALNDLSGCTYLPECDSTVTFGQVDLYVTIKFDFDCVDLQDARVDHVAVSIHSFDYKCTPVWIGLKVPGVRDRVTKKLETALEKGIQTALTSMLRRRLHLRVPAATSSPTAYVPIEAATTLYY